MLAVNPRAHDRLAGVAFALRYLAFVMREDVVHAAGVQVEFAPQILDGHGGTFYVPAGESVSPRAAPLDHPARLRRLPQREIARVALERVGFHAHRLQQLRLVNVARQLAVIGESRDFEIDVAVRFVCVSPFEQLADNLYHLRDVVGGFGEFLGGADSQLRLVRAESPGVEIGDFGGRLAFF